jgi:signal transduction histidine kinase
MSQFLKGKANRSEPDPTENDHLPYEKNLDRLRGDLIAMVYHDIRSPLSTIVASLEVLSSTALNTQDATAQSMIEIAQRSAKRIQHLVDSLLDIDRLESGQEIGSRASTSLQTIVDEAVRLILPMAEIKGINVTQSLEANLPQVDIDEDMILRVLINLLENAVKFSRGQGTIQVSLEQQGDMILTAIRDNGPGIAPSEQERIFQKYARPNILADGGGLGLGLAYCRLAVNSHGGQIWVESKPGNGAAFKFTLPTAQSY